MIAQRLEIRGRVQGVGYRDQMVDVARSLGVAGWVRNRRDGAVEALIQGDPADVLRLLAWCRRGPSSARVTGVSITAADPDARLESFERRPSA
jgi:acylphosphatase